ncbi:MAG: rhomboid family intramembrane serine protease [Bacteroidetes bacterium]|nr:rhomboid family intramembrane serine protease [Bacteroidota bacterium]
MPTFSFAPATWTIVIITAMITIVAFRDVSLMERWLFVPQRVLRDRQWYRLLTSGFIHADYMHLLFNMVSMLFIASYVEHVLGVVRMVPLYVAGIVVGNLATMALRRHEPWMRAVGASGGVSAMIGALICMIPDASFMIFPVPIPIPAWIYGILFLVGSIFGMRRGTDNIGHEAHAGGMLVGIAAIVMYRPLMIVDHILYVALVVIVPTVVWLVLRRRPLV